MKVLLIFVFSLVYSVSYAQEWEYAFIYEISSGMVQTKAEFTFGSKYDSVKAYGKFKHAIDALDFSSRKGWELFQIYTQRTTAEATIYLLRRKKVLNSVQ